MTYGVASWHNKINKIQCFADNTKVISMIYFNGGLTE